VSKPLVVVESPTKVRTLKKYLGKEYNVAATVGHIKDLPNKEIGIDIDNGFKPKYRVIPGKQKVITSIKKAAGDADKIYLAPDPDREGEAIAWHISEVLKKKGRTFHRVLFHELTKNAIQASIATPQDLDRNKYAAQQARRLLDRLVGYQVSPMLWRKVKGGLSAGRVQSVAVRIICERERAIQAFEPEEYWSITAHVEGSTPPPFAAKLAKKEGQKIKISDEQAAKEVLKELDEHSLVVEKVVKKTTKRNPQPPFITSKLQQEAIRKLRFSAKKTMVLAQQLYEGIDLGPGEPEGLITYMRTDSTRISKEAADEALQLIRESYGPNYAESKPRFFKNKNKAQDAHEAIRPTSVFNTPEKLEKFLSKDQLALYRLIWQRFIASQMTPAQIYRNTVTIAAGPYLFSATGSSIKFPGFLSLYQSADEKLGTDKPIESLPDLEKGDVLTLLKYDPKQHFTAPPPRFSEASLVKELEENGIGRPSTYASILSTIREKGYVDLVQRYFRPNELGFIVNDLLVQNFPDVFNVDFTANMENELDQVEAANMASLDVLNRFYSSFQKELDQAAEQMLSIKGVGLPTELSCPICGKELRIKMGRNGHFLACSGYPECTFSSDYLRNEKGQIERVQVDVEETADEICPKCQRPMVIKLGKYGKFLACSGFPECNHTQSLFANGEQPSTGVNCPENGCDGEIVEKKSRRGKIFYGCNRYPDCSFALWDKPVDKACSDCGAPFLISKSTKKAGNFLACHTKGCHYKEILD
jgi:DNA topoisomerase-1